MPETTTGPMTLADAAQAYLASLQPAARRDQTPEVQRVTRWLGSDRRMSDLRAVDIERYAEESSNVSDAEARLKVVRSFLSYASKQGMTPANLSIHVRLSRRAGSGGRGETLTEERLEVTADGLAALRQELEAYRAQRPQIAEALRAAMADKDFRENAPLDAAREHQAHVEARIRELEAMLKRAVVVQSSATGLARLGSRVRLRDAQSGREVTYILVGPGEVNAAEGKISVASPVGRALVDHAVGEEVEVVAPSKTFRYRIESIDA